MEPPPGVSLLCIRSWLSTHPRVMNLSVDDEALVVAARSGERGPLRNLAVSLDERLGDEDACLDGAVLAWRAVHGGCPRSAAIIAAGVKRFVTLRRRLVEARATPASRLQVAPVAPANRGPATDRRPAA
jgi:hypothetical protein